MELFETVELMNSAEYENGFIAEYLQLKERYNRLCNMLDDWDNGNLTFTPKCSRSIYHSQISAMKSYLNVLELRARIENINLNINL